MSIQTDDWITREKKRIEELSDQIVSASKGLKVLSNLAWPNTVKQAFFDSGAKSIPQVKYLPLESHEHISVLEGIETRLGDTPVDEWFRRTISTLKNTARMLENRGNKDFYEYSQRLFGKPTDKLKDERSHSLDLAKRYLSILEPIQALKLDSYTGETFDADHLAEKMIKATQTMFGTEAPVVSVVDELSANALAGSERVRIRRGAVFSDKDVVQLIEHEVHIHVATILNGKTKGNLSLLSLSHPGATKTQEGLAVFAELITGSLDLNRLRRLADRVIAIQMAIEGANFIDIYRYFLEQTDQPDQSFENARRVFRGGVVEGGAPFTKDIVYLDGLLRVHNFMRAAVSVGRADSINLLFTGRLDLEDLPVLSYLRALGLCHKPRFLPHWASDLRFLLTYLSYSSFSNSIDMSKVNEHYREVLESVGQVF